MGEPTRIVPNWEIEIGHNAAATSIKVNGVDITHDIYGAIVEITPAKVTKVTLQLVPGHARGRVMRAIENVELVEAPPPEEQDATTTDPSTTT